MAPARRVTPPARVCQGFVLDISLTARRPCTILPPSSGSDPVVRRSRPCKTGERLHRPRRTEDEAGAPGGARPGRSAPVNAARPGARTSRGRRTRGAAPGIMAAASTTPPTRQACLPTRSGSRLGAPGRHRAAPRASAPAPAPNDDGRTNGSRPAQCRGAFRGARVGHPNQTDVDDASLARVSGRRTALHAAEASPHAGSQRATEGRLPRVRTA